MDFKFIDSEKRLVTNCVCNSAVMFLEKRSRKIIYVIAAIWTNKIFGALRQYH